MKEQNQNIDANSLKSIGARIRKFSQSSLEKSIRVLANSKDDAEIPLKKKYTQANKEDNNNRTRYDY